MHWRRVRGLICEPRQRILSQQVDEKNIILVKEVKPNETYEDMDKTAKMHSGYVKYRGDDLGTCVLRNHGR